MYMRRSSSAVTSGRRRTPRTSAEMAALAPMPRANVSTTVAARPLVRPSERSAILRSLRNDMLLLPLPSDYNRLAFAVRHSMKPQTLPYCTSNEIPRNRHDPQKNAYDMRTIRGKRQENHVVEENASRTPSQINLSSFP